MADKSTAIPIDICEDVPVVVANVTILTDFVSHPDFHATKLKLINHDKMWFDKNF